jgi:rhamnulokinase
MAAAAPPRRAFIDPDDPRFATPGDMPARIQAACRASGQPVPETPGDVVRCALDSLALKYRTVLQALERLTQRRIEIVHLVGGGVRNELLNQLTADAVGRPVIAGPREAAAIGNVLVQAMAQGRFARPGELREVVRGSVALNTYEPRNTAAWEEAAAHANLHHGM